MLYWFSNVETKIIKINGMKFPRKYTKNQTINFSRQPNSAVRSGTTIWTHPKSKVSGGRKYKKLVTGVLDDEQLYNEIISRIKKTIHNKTSNDEIDLSFDFSEFDSS